MKTDAIQKHLHLADEIRAIMQENQRLRNELNEAMGFIVGMLLTNNGELAYRPESPSLQLYNGLKNSVAQLLDNGLELIESHVELRLNFQGSSELINWETIKEKRPELFYQ